MTLRAIDPSPLRARYAGHVSEPGERPELQWLKINRLRIDPSYQREIARKGEYNILAIATHFHWGKFTPVIVAPIGSNLFAIVDGQHRTTAAALRGFESVPCVIISADAAQQADAFVAINASVTMMTPLQIHAARLAAGDRSASELVEVCREADVTICRYPIPANKIKPGETLAVSMLRDLLKKYGRDILIAALCCITKTRQGNPGMIRAQIMDALCVVLQEAQAWRGDRKRLLFTMQTFDFAAQFNAARAASIENGKKIATILAGAIGEHLNRAPPAPAEKPSAPKPVAAAEMPKAAPSGVLSIGRDTISFRGQVRVSPRGALLVAALAKAKPSFVGDAFLISRIWNARPLNSAEMMDALVSDLACLKAIGLEVQTQRALGRRLVEIDA